MSVVKFWLPIVATAAVLVGVEMMSQPSHARPPEAVAYMTACREAGDEIPYTLSGGWVGEDSEVPMVAEEMLRPNLLISRSYSDLSGTQRVALLIVQGGDVQRLLGHYPPICYPGRGWTNLGAEPGDWSVDGLDIDGTIYRMVPPGGDMERPVFIYNFFLRPDGNTGRDTDALWATGQGGLGRFLGAGQVQVLFFGDMDEAARNDAFERVVTASMPVIDEVLHGFDDE